MLLTEVNSVYKRLYINLHYTQRGIIAHKECSETQMYEFSDDEYYFNNTRDHLGKDIDKILSLLQRHTGSFIQVGSYESYDCCKSEERQIFYFEYINGHFSGTKNGGSWNVVEYKDKQMKLKEVKQSILDFFSNGLKI